VHRYGVNFWGYPTISTIILLYLKYICFDVSKLRNPKNHSHQMEKTLLEKYYGEAKYQTNLLLTAHHNNSNIMINTVETRGLNMKIFFTGIYQEDVGKNPF